MKETVWKWTARSAGAAILSGLALTGSAFAQEASEVSAYVDNSYLFLISGMVVMFMAAGFCMLEVGLVRSKNAATQAVKNVMLYSVAGIMVYLVGYHMIYPADGWLIEGVLAAPDWLWSEGDREALDGAGYAPASDWYFQMVFVATAASIVSGTVAERIKILPFMIFVAVLTGFIYPIQASWKWGGGFLDQMGFLDFAGSTVVHSVGGWAALTGALILGPRIGKYKDGAVHPMLGSNLPLATLGTFILWLGWFGFNGGSQLAMGTVGDVADISRIFANTNAAAAGGAVAALLLTQFLFKKPDLTMVLNGALAGLVSITAEPLTPSLGLSTLIGAVGGVIVVFVVPLLDRLKIDDVVGAIPVHLVAGIWGTLAVVLSNSDASLMTQLTGILVIGAFVCTVSAAVWLVLRMTLGIRVDEEDEVNGLDMAELGMEAYPEFSLS